MALCKSDDVSKSSKKRGKNIIAPSGSHVTVSVDGTWIFSCVRPLNPSVIVLTDRVATCLTDRVTRVATSMM